MIGDAGEGFSDLVVGIIQRHVPDPDVETLMIRDSSKGCFLLMRALITATDADQLQAIHNDLRATGHVRMVL